MRFILSWTLFVCVMICCLQIMFCFFLNRWSIFFLYLFYPDTGSKVSFNAHSVSLPVYERKSCAQIYGTSDIEKRVCAGYLYNGKGICKACNHFYVYLLTAADLLLHKTCKKKYNKIWNLALLREIAAGHLPAETRTDAGSKLVWPHFQVGTNQAVTQPSLLECRHIWTGSTKRSNNDDRNNSSKNGICQFFDFIEFKNH